MPRTAPDRPPAAYAMRSVSSVMMSTGFAETRMMAPGAFVTICGMTMRKMAALRPSSSIRDSPGRWLTPADMTTTLASPRLSYVPAADPNRRGERRRVSNVSRLGLGLGLVDVDEDQLTG